MSDACKTMLVTLQENGIIRKPDGKLIGHLSATNNIKIAELFKRVADGRAKINKGSQDKAKD